MSTSDRWAWAFLVRPLRVVDGDTFDAVVDLGFGITLGMGRPFRFRLVGPEGEWFDAAESRGPKAQEAGRVAADALRAAFAPILAGEGLVAVRTFKPDGRDAFGRWLAYPYAIVTSEGGTLPFDPVRALVDAGVARLGSRFPAPASTSTP